MRKTDFCTVDSAIASGFEDGEKRGKVRIEDDGFDRFLTHISTIQQANLIRQITLRASILPAAQRRAILGVRGAGIVKEERCPVLEGRCRQSRIRMFG